MEIKEKLDAFYTAAIEAAKSKGDAVVNEYTKIYEESISEYEKQKRKEYESIRLGRDAEIRHEINREVSERILLLKKEYHEETIKKKEQLFACVSKKLAEYKKTEEYRECLARKIRTAFEIAKGEAVTVYLDASDASLKETVEAETGCELTISETDFMGGIRAVIRSKNMLIDESFLSRLAEEKASYGV